MFLFSVYVQSSSLKRLTYCLLEGLLLADEHVRHLRVEGPDLRHDTVTDGPATLTEGEVLALGQSDGERQLAHDLLVVTRHHHDEVGGAVAVAAGGVLPLLLGGVGLRALRLREVDVAGHVRSAEEELRAVVLEERLRPATLLLGQNVHVRLEVVHRGHVARLAQHHSPLDVLGGQALAHHTDVVTGLGGLKRLAEGLHARALRRLRLAPVADKLKLVLQEQGAGLDGTRAHHTLARHRERGLHRHEERLVRATDGGGDGGVDGLHQVEHRLLPLRVAVQGAEGRAPLELRGVDVKLVHLEQLLDLLLDELRHVVRLVRVEHVHLVHEHHQLRHTDLVREQNVLAGLRHRAVRRRHNEDGAVQLGRTRHHVLHVVRVARAVNVRVVARLRLVLNVGGVDRNLPGLLLRRLVDREVVLGLGEALLRHHARDSGGQRGLAVVNVADRADVDVGLLLHEGGPAEQGPRQARESRHSSGLERMRRRTMKYRYCS
eukprot:Rhum_TRINITY_DN14813_c5_g1::Rhum_TRINITY_DN14813_c5_g1_i1::g.120510::m.120510